MNDNKNLLVAMITGLVVGSFLGYFMGSRYNGRPRPFIYEWDEYEDVDSIAHDSNDASSAISSTDLYQ